MCCDATWLDSIDRRLSNWSILHSRWCFKKRSIWKHTLINLLAVCRLLPIFGCCWWNCCCSTNCSNWNCCCCRNWFSLNCCSWLNCCFLKCWCCRNCWYWIGWFWAGSSSKRATLHENNVNKRSIWKHTLINLLEGVQCCKPWAMLEDTNASIPKSKLWLALFRRESHD